MFQFPGFASLRILYLQYSGLPHSDICGSHRMCQSPQLIAAYHVLHRLLAPRHPLYALNNLIPNFSWNQVLKSQPIKTAFLKSQSLGLLFAIKIRLVVFSKDCKTDSVSVFHLSWELNRYKSKSKSKSNSTVWKNFTRMSKSGAHIRNMGLTRKM